VESRLKSLIVTAALRGLITARQAQWLIAVLGPRGA
jgi:hypothetical protein